MNITASIKRAPRWAWYTAAGVGVGAAALKLYKGRASEDPIQTTTDGTPPGSMTGSTPVLTASPTSVITPTVVGVPSAGNDGGSLLDMMGLWTGAVQTTIDQLSSIYSPVAGIEASLLERLPDLITQNQVTPDQLLQAMQGGQAPTIVVQTPSAAGNTAIPAAATPTQTQAPAPETPVVVASRPQCGGSYPEGSPNDPHGCYYTYNAPKGNSVGRRAGRWHIHQNGYEQYMGA